MLWSIGLNIGEGFAELEAKNDESGNSLTSRWPTLSKSIHDELESFLKTNNISEVSHLNVSTQLEPYFFDKKLGTPPAFLVTQGFEDWLELSSPVTRSYQEGRLDRPTQLIDSDFVFGISERLSSTGNVLKPVQEKELEFIVSKLEFQNVKNISIGLLHSDQNPEHEDFINNYLTERGFNTRSSSQFKSIGKSLYRDEKKRWLHCLKETYLESAFEEFFESFFLSKVFQDYQLEGKTFFINGEGVAQPFDACQWVHSQWACNKKLQAQNQNNEVSILCGLDRWSCVLPQEPSWPNREREPFCDLPFQPTMPLSLNRWGLPTSGPIPLGFLPGPMCFGRGQNLTLLDLLFVTYDLSKIEGINIKNSQKQTLRVHEALQVLNQDLAGEEFDPENLAKDIFKDHLYHLAPIIIRASKVILTGPLAPAFHHLLSNIHGLDKNLLINDSPWSPCFSSPIKQGECGL